MRRYVNVGLFWLLAVLWLMGSVLSAPADSVAARFGEERSQKLTISDVGISTSKFNPRSGERVEIKFSLSKDAMVSLKIFDPDFELVQTVLDKETKRAGAHQAAWDGKDMDGSPAPDEAYFFTIEATDNAGHVDVYDPTAFSGGEVYDVAQADVDKEANKIRYRLEHPGRVLIRMGVHRGPLLRTLVDWQPRPPGPNAEPWDGKDESGVVDLRDDPHFVATITYFTLPENSILTVGNNNVSYEDYKARSQTKRPKKEDRGRNIMSKRPISPHFSQPRTAYRNPHIQVTLPDVKHFTGRGGPLVDGTAVVRVDMNEKDTDTIKDRKTELYFFLDNRFLVEEGDARIPYNFRWDFSNVEAGEHLLTVNLITDNNQIGTVSKQVVVKRSQGAR